jgi:hypothetical protein
MQGHEPFEALVRQDGPILENILEGDKVDVLTPVPDPPRADQCATSAPLICASN